MTEKWYMATDQYGNTYHSLKHPRKDLCKILGKKHVAKMYEEDNNGGNFFVGYVIGGYWLTLYEVKPIMEKIT